MDDKHLKILENLLQRIKENISEALKEIWKIRYLPIQETREKPGQQKQEPEVHQESFSFPTKEEAAEDEEEGDIPF